MRRWFFGVCGACASTAAPDHITITSGARVCVPTLYVAVTRKRDRGPRPPHGVERNKPAEPGKQNLAGQPA